MADIFDCIVPLLYYWEETPPGLNGSSGLKWLYISFKSDKFSSCYNMLFTLVNPRCLPLRPKGFESKEGYLDTYPLNSDYFS